MSDEHVFDPETDEEEDTESRELFEDEDEDVGG